MPKKTYLGEEQEWNWVGPQNGFKSYPLLKRHNSDGILSFLLDANDKIQISFQLSGYANKSHLLRDSQTFSETYISSRQLLVYSRSFGCPVR